MADFNPGSALPRLQPLPQGTNDQTIVQLHKSLMTVYQAVTALNNQLTYMFEGHLDVNNIRSQGIETDNLKAGAVTADKIFVEFLSAISADLGHMKAGLVEAIKMVGSTIIGSYIGTREPGLFPRTEMSVSGGYFGVWESANKGIRIIEDYLGQGVALDFNNGLVGGGAMYMYSDKLALKGQSDLEFEANEDIDFIVGGINKVKFPSLYTILDKSTGRTLGQDIDDLRSQISSINGSISSLYSICASLSDRISALGG